MKQFFDGAQARDMGGSAQNILMDFLRSQIEAARLADPVLALWPAVLVTGSVATASAKFKGDDNAPFVCVTQGAHTPTFERIRYQGEIYRGQRHELRFQLQISAKNDAQSRLKPGATADLDRKLCDLVMDVVTRGYLALRELGLSEAAIRADAEQQGNPNLINPHVVTAVAYTREELAF